MCMLVMGVQRRFEENLCIKEPGTVSVSSWAFCLWNEQGKLSISSADRLAIPSFLAGYKRKWIYYVVDVG
jgi:hypothetical protein